LDKNKILYILISVIFLITDIFYAQNNKLDSLEKLLVQGKLESFNSKYSLITKDSLNYNNDFKIKLLFLKAKFYYKKDKTEKALEYYKKIEKYAISQENFLLLSDVNYEIFLLLKSQNNLQNDKEARKNLNNYYKYALKVNDRQKITKAYMAFAGLMFNPKDYNKALEYYSKAKKICIEEKDYLTLAKTYSNEGAIIQLYKHKFDSARILYKKALNIYSKLNNKKKAFNISVNISSSYKRQKNYPEAIKWLKKADSIPITSYKINSKKLLYKLMSKNYESLNDYKNANFYLKKHLAYKDSVDIKEQNIAISDIQTKYETAKKEKDIIKLKAEKDKQTNYMIIGGGSFIFILLLGILTNYNLKRKKDVAEKNRQLEHQKVVSLMKEQELKTLDAIVEGQEKERKRIAEDLHDNLGSKLAVLKLQFDSFMDNESTKQNKQFINGLKNTSNLLEDTYQTVRSMSHVESKREIQQSLVHAVKTLAVNISNSNKLVIEVIDFGLEQPLNHKIEITTLRIIQELLTNIIKYAEAQKVTIDLTLFDDILGIIVSDDGVGFKTSKIKNEGLGLKSIKKRVLKLNGTVNIDSGLGNGTTIIIELPIKQNKL
jgi:signal transduction histidine kinase